jgi:peptide/nickel transport system permease protein
MATTPEALPVGAAPTREEREYIASQWKLVWWKFRRHRLAMISTIMVLMLYGVAAFPGFLSIQDPRDSSSKRVYMPPQRIHLFDGLRPRPFVYHVTGARNPVTLGMEHTQDKSVKHYINFFVRGHEYTFIGLFDTNIHLFGTDADGMNSLYPLGTDKLGRGVYSRLVYGRGYPCLLAWEAWLSASSWVS